MNSASKSKYDDKSIDQGGQSMINAYDLGPVEEMDPTLRKNPQIVAN